MSTSSTLMLDTLAADWSELYSSAIISGIVGNTAHEQRGGYHISIEDQVNSSNYSVIRPDDKAPPGTWPRDRAAGIDMNLKLPDMKICHARLKAVWQNRANDPRASYINAWNGWDGTGSPGRYDMVSGTVSTASDDHEWHVHLEIRRRYVNSPVAKTAILSILSGQSLAAYLGTGDSVTTREDAKQGIADAFAEAAATTDDTTANDTVWGRQFRKSLDTVIDFTGAAGPLADAVNVIAVQQKALQASVSALQASMDALLAAHGGASDGALTPDDVQQAVKQALREGTATP